MVDIFEEVQTVDVNAEQEMDMFDYAKQIIACQMEQKSIADDIKVIKAEAKEKGVLVKEIDSAISQLKREAKLLPADAKLQEEVLEKLRSNKDIADTISMLV